MNEADIFVSVGGTANEKQEAFVRSVEDRLRSEGLNPHTVGRNTFSSDSPLTTVKELMEKCSGTIVIALERTYFPSGVEKRGGPNEQSMIDIKLPTSWNQIEATMSYVYGLPLMVIVEKGVKSEGLLEQGYDWYVQYLETDPSSLNSNEFNGVLASWKKKVFSKKQNQKKSNFKSPEKMTVSELVGGLKPAHLWSVLGAIFALIVGAFTLGLKLNGGP